MQLRRNLGLEVAQRFNTRFVKPVAWGQPVNIVMYQAGQALLVLSLAIGT